MIGKGIDHVLLKCYWKYMQ